MIRTTTPSCCHRLDSLDGYAELLPGEPLLTAEEEKSLAHAIKRGDKQARERLIRSNLRLVVKIARDYLGRGLPLEDLVGEGNLGLIRASEEYDPRFGTRFSTYAAYWIKQSIRHALVTTTSTIRVPAHMVTLLSRWRRAERAFLREHGHAPTAEQLAEILDLSPSQRKMVAQAQRAKCLCGELPRSARSHGSGDVEDPQISPESRMEAMETKRDLLRRMNRLDPRERTVVVLRFGLGDQTALTLKEVGKRLGVTREWVRKIEIRAIRKLEDPVPEPSQAQAQLHAPEKSPNRLRAC